MAYYNDDEQNLDQNGQPIAAQSGVVGSEGGQAQGGASSSPQSSASPSANPSNFVGIQQYLQANKPQSAKLASNVGGYVNQLGDTARSTINQSGQQYQSDVNKNTVNLNQDLLNRAKSAPQQVVGSQPDLNEFYRERDAEYKGPESFQSSNYYNPAKQAVDKANQAAANTQTEQGRRELLQEYQPKTINAKINKGANTFDLALLQSDPNARSILNQAQQNQSGLNDVLGKTGLDASGKDISAQGKAVSQATKDAIARAFSGYDSPQAQLERELVERGKSQVGSAQTNSANELKAISQLGDLTDAQLKDLGITKDQYNKLREDAQAVKGYGGSVDLSKYGSQISDPNILSQRINPQNIASADDYAKYMALNQLMGTNNVFLKDPSQAGLANLDLADFDINKALADYGGLRKQYEDALALQNAPKYSESVSGKPGVAVPVVERGLTAGYNLGTGAASTVGALGGGVANYANKAIQGVFGNTPAKRDYTPQEKSQINSSNLNKESNRIDAAVKEGNLSQAHADAMKKDLNDYYAGKLSAEAYEARNNLPNMSAPTFYR